MPNLPDPRDPLSKMEIAVYGVDSYRHPVTGIPVTRPAMSIEGPGWDPNTQAYRNHLPYIRTVFGEAKYLEIKPRWMSLSATAALSTCRR